MSEKTKINRLWRGWTSPENAPVYESMLVNEVFPAVKKKGVAGLEKVSISTRSGDAEVEFLLLLQFDTIESVKAFAGEDYENAYIPDNARRILKRYDEKALHYKFKQELNL